MFNWRFRVLDTTQVYLRRPVPLVKSWSDPIIPYIKILWKVVSRTELSVNRGNSIFRTLTTEQGLNDAWWWIKAVLRYIVTKYLMEIIIYSQHYSALKDCSMTREWEETATENGPAIAYSFSLMMQYRQQRIPLRVSFEPLGTSGWIKDHICEGNNQLWIKSSCS